MRALPEEPMPKQRTTVVAQVQIHDGLLAFPSGSTTSSSANTRDGGQMGDIVDKVTGKTKQAVGDITGDRSLHREGRKEERKGDAKDEAARAQDKADEKAQEVANLERDTN